MKLRPNEPPPADYYADNLTLFAQGVLGRYGDFLTADEMAFGKSICESGAEARRLLARILYRKVKLIRIDSLRYREVTDLARAVSELVNRGLVLLCPAAPVEDLLAMLARKELLGLTRPEDVRLRKSELICEVAKRLSLDEIHETLEREFPWLALGSPELLELYQLLFFGSRHTDLSAFVLRDLGLFRFEDYRLDPCHRMFADRGSLDRMLAVYGCADRAQEAIDADDVEAMVEVAHAMPDSAANRVIERRRSRTLNALGRRLEQLKALDCALEVYACSVQPPARERRVRILSRMIRKEEATRFLQEVRESPLSIEEREFANRFGKSRQTPIGFRIDSLQLSMLPTGAIERHTAEVLTQNGGIAVHLESSLPSALFALAYWDWLFEDVPGAFVNEFQSAPLDLSWPDFFATRVNRVADPLETEAPLIRRILATAVEKRGVACALVNWSKWEQELLEQVTSGLEEEGIRRLLSIVRRDLSLARRGFPDLTVIYGRGRFEFVEVKGPGDQLQPAQRVWLNQLTSAGLPCRLLKWKLVN